MSLSQAKEVTAEGYFFAGKSPHWLVLGVSLLTSCIISPYALALTPSGWNAGVAISYGIISAILLIIVGRFLAPVFFNANLTTVPEYFEKRFNRACRFIVSGLSIAGTLFVRLTVVLAGGSLLISRVAGVDAFSSLLLLLTLTGLYVVIGGLRAELPIGVAQILLIMLALAGYGWWIMGHGGSSGAFTRTLSSIDILGRRDDSLFSWTGIVSGLPVLGFWFWGADQMVVQKLMSARNAAGARAAATAAGVLQIVPVLVVVLLGGFYALPSDAAASGESLQAMVSDGLLPRVLHVGVVIAIASAFTAAVAALFNSTSTLITFDFYRCLKPEASDRKLVLVGRLSSVLLWLCSVLLIPVAQSMDVWLCLELFKLFAYVAAMVAALLMVGLLARRISALSALVTFCTATGIILARAVLVILLRAPLFDNGLLDWFVQAEFLQFAVFVFLLSVACLFLFDRLEWLHHMLRVDGTYTRSSS